MRLEQDRQATAEWAVSVATEILLSPKARDDIDLQDCVREVMKALSLAKKLEVE